MQFKLLTATTLLAITHTVLAFPRMDPESFAEVMKRAGDIGTPDIRDGQVGRIIQFDPPQPFNGTKMIPDADHPYIAPGPNDLRGPCPALNTLANHGYIPRNGSATVEQIQAAVMEAFNVEHDFAAFVVSFATLGRGNAFLGRLSIGTAAQDIPPLPGMIDGATAGGIALHGRFEGDVSMSRRDVHIGDNVNFQNEMFDEILLYIGAYGDDGPEGKHTVINHKVFQEFKYDRFMQDQQEDKQLEFHIARVFTAFSEVAFVLEFFANGTTGNITANGMATFFRNQTFAPNWFRRASPAGLAILAKTSTDVRCAHPISPGANDENGNYVVDSGPMCDGSFDFLCASYNDLIQNNVAASLNNQTGIMKTNIDYMLQAIHKPFFDLGGCEATTPAGLAGV